MTFMLWGIQFHWCADEMLQWSMAVPFIGPFLAVGVLRVRTYLRGLAPPKAQAGESSDVRAA